MSLARIGRTFLAVLFVTACGTDSSNDTPAPPTSFKIGGTASGVQNSGLVLRLNDKEDLAISSNGAFSFTGELSDTAPYAIKVKSRPAYPNNTCELENGSGTVNAADVSDVEIKCRTTFYLRRGDMNAASTKLYVSDGTAAGTVPIKDFVQFDEPQGPIVTAGDVTFFRTREGLWQTDGSTAGTKLVKSVGVANPIGMGDKIYFFGQENFVHLLWASDGTEAGTAPVSSVGVYAGHLSQNDLEAANHRLFFGGLTAGSDGFDLWSSDGTEAGTIRIKDLERKDGAPGFPLGPSLAVADRKIYFSVKDSSSGADRFAIWKSDGDLTGTVPVKDLGDLDAEFLGVSGSKLFFRADDGNNGLGLWVSDGTPAGTRLLKSDVSFGKGKAVGDRTFFFRSFFDGVKVVCELWVSDGTEMGTQLVKDCDSGRPTSIAGSCLPVAQTFFVQIETDTHGRELWKSDGTELGTGMIKDINPGPASSDPSFLMAVGNTLYFVANDGVHGRQLWKSDGCDTGTVRVTDFAFSGNDGFAELLLGREISNVP